MCAVLLKTLEFSRNLLHFAEIRNISAKMFMRKEIFIVKRQMIFAKIKVFG